MMVNFVNFSDLISKRSQINTEEEEKLNNVPLSTIRKASNTLLKINPLKLDLEQINKSYKKNTTQTFHPTQENKDDNYNLKDSERANIVMDHYSRSLSEIEKDFLYLSSYNAAKNEELIKKNQITHIVNVAGDVCDNHFESYVKYIKFNLKDHSTEVIYYIIIEY